MELFDKCELSVKGKKYIVKKGDIFYRLEVKALYRNKNFKWYAICQCSCENRTERHVLVRHLISGNTKSCGCYNRDLCIERSTKHNAKHRGSSDKLYSTWVEMRRRCYTESCDAYKNYGERGITICPEWDNFNNFREWALISGYEDGLTIERLNVNGNYEPLNCTWIPKNEQSKNRRMCHFVDYNGLSMTISDWSRYTGIHRTTITRRLKKGLPLDEVFKK
jgi:hypothetical protein